MSNVNRKSDKLRLIFTVFSALLILVIAIIASMAWFTVDNDVIKMFDLSVGNVSVRVNKTATDLFYHDFDTGDDYGEEEIEIDDDGYIAAASIDAIKVQGEEIPPGTAYVLAQDSKVKLNVIFDKVKVTDRILWSSSSSAITVSAYGTIRAMGNVGDTATITITAVDRTPQSTRPNIVRTVTVTVGEPDATSSNEYGYLPGMTDVLRNPLEIINYSTVDIKLRIKLTWEYNDYDIADTNDNPRKKYNVKDILETSGYSASTDILNGAVSPITANLNSSWNDASAEGKLYFTDSTGVQWTVETLSLTNAEKASFDSYLAGTGSFTFSQSMIDKAYACYYYGTQTNSQDYGDTIAKSSLAGVSEPTAEQIDENTFTVMESLTTSDGYASYSTRKVFNIGITVQARQAKAYDEDEWYDVYGIGTYDHRTH